MQNAQPCVQTAIQPVFEVMKFIAPTLEEVKERAKSIDLPEREAEKFFLYYEANGWRAGRAKIQKWAMALAGWKLRWEERQPNKSTHGTNGNTVLTSAQTVLFHKEYERVQAKLEDTDYTGSTCGWTPKLVEQRKTLINRKKELRQLLGITI